MSDDFEKAVKLVCHAFQDAVYAARHPADGGRRELTAIQIGRISEVVIRAEISSATTAHLMSVVSGSPNLEALIDSEKFKPTAVLRGTMEDLYRRALEAAMFDLVVHEQMEVYRGRVREAVNYVVKVVTTLVDARPDLVAQEHRAPVEVVRDLPGILVSDRDRIYLLHTSFWYMPHVLAAYRQVVGEIGLDWEVVSKAWDVTLDLHELALRHERVFEAALSKEYRLKERA
jgi:hypothetical protein